MRNDNGKALELAVTDFSQLQAFQKDARNEDFADVIKEQYSKIYRLYRNDFELLANYKSTLELLAEFDNVSGELTKFNGWLQAIPPNSNNEYKGKEYAKITLEPLKLPGGIIYHFHGCVEWLESSFFKGRIVPLSIAPVYELPSGKITKFEHCKMGDSRIFEDIQVEYWSIDLKLKLEK